MTQDIEKMFDKISSNYDFLNNIISFFTHKKVKEIAVKSLKIKPNSSILDLCTGSGDLGRIVKNLYPSCKVTGADFSEKMLEIARLRNKEINYIKADAINLPFKNSEFDYILMGFGLRNIQDKKSAINEVLRTLKPGGKFLHLDFGEKNFTNKIFDFYVLLLTKLLSKDYDAYSYLINSKNSFFKPCELIEFFKSSGFEQIECKKMLFDIISYQICRKN